jgi:hypothetical protein
MEVFDSVRCLKVIMRYPLVLANIVSPPFDEVLHTTVSNATVTADYIIIVILHKFCNVETHKLARAITHSILNQIAQSRHH